MWSTTGQRSWIAARFDGMFVYLCIIICSAWLLSICFSSPLVVPTPVAAAESIHRSIPQPKLHLGEKKQHQHFAWLGRARSSSWCHHWNCRADAREVFCTLSKAQGLRTARCSRSGMGWAGSALCLQPALDKPLLLHVPANPCWVSLLQ